MRIAKAIGLAAACTLLVTTTAMAGRDVIVGDASPGPRAKIIEPRADPMGRVVVKNDRLGKGFVEVPDEPWELTVFRTNGPFTPASALGIIRSGERLRLRAGCYRGDWTDAHVSTFFCIESQGKDVSVVWRGRGTDGIFKIERTLPYGCVWKSKWKFLEPRTMTWVHDRTNHRRRAIKRVAPPGFYGPLYPIKGKGITCVS